MQIVRYYDQTVRGMESAMVVCRWIWFGEFL